MRGFTTKLTSLLEQAVVALRRGKPRQAITLLRRARRLEKSSALVYYNLGLAYEAIRRDDQAMRCYQKALRCDPTLTDAVVCQGYLYGVRGNIKRELACYDQVLRRDPRHKIAVYNKAIALDDGLENPRAAIPWYRRVLKFPLTSKERRDVYLRLIYTYLDTRRYRKAMQVLQKMIAMGKA